MHKREFIIGSHLWIGSKICNTLTFSWSVLQLGLSTHDNTTPVRLIHNTAAHLQGTSRTIGAVIIGCSGVRTFCPNPVSKLIECIGGVSALLGLVAMATDVEGLYASVKALSCVLRGNPSARRDMERTRGYQVHKSKQHVSKSESTLICFPFLWEIQCVRTENILSVVLSRKLVDES